MKYSVIKITKHIPYLLIVLTTITWTSCNDFIDVGPPKTEITTATVFSNDASATSAVVGIYSLMMTNQCFMKGDLERYTGLSSDELDNFSSNSQQIQFAQSQLLNTNTVTYRSFWGQAYTFISNANAALEGLESGNGLTPSLRNQLRGEALFIRAYCHLYLTALFGDVPYVTTTDYNVNSIMPRLTSTSVYNQIIADLEQAKLLLSDDYPADAERIRPNRSAATALLARVYLYTSAWDKAESQATEVISKTSQYQLQSDLSKVFLANSDESIWQLKPVSSGMNAPQGQVFILTSTPARALGGVALSSSVLNTFEAGDKRSTQWIGKFTSGATTYSFPYKYKQAFTTTVTEYSTILRLAEQYLIRAEARVKLNKTELAKEDINKIRTRAGLSDITSSDNNSILDAIARERVAELFTESGHRWIDLRRTGKADEVMGAKRPNWQATDQLYPIPNAERLINTNLTQNTGY